MDMNKKEDNQNIPDTILDQKTGTIYRKGRFFGKGGFAKCYEIVDKKTDAVYAGKIVSKSLMLKHNQRDKMAQEIAIHSELKHKHIVGFYGFFEDSLNIYIVLELCKKRSMMELQKRRKTLTEPEIRYFLGQILDGVLYLHKNSIIHRDLKLGNLFINENMQVKIGDFGLAARIEHEGERKKTLCGTPNYIAPEILEKRGHSFEVDVWSIGCIVYTLLFGRPPFETSTLKETYSRIRKCEYKLPTNASKPASTIIKKMLQFNPQARPTVESLISSEFMTNGFHPKELPVSCLTMAPRLDISGKPKEKSPRKPLIEVNIDNPGVLNAGGSKSPNPRQSTVMAAGKIHSNKTQETRCRSNLKKIQSQLAKLLENDPAKENMHFGDDATDPASTPFVWISKWVDYSDKYGFGYQLSDESVGVMFNDKSKIIQLPDGSNVHYIEKDGTEHYHSHNNFPENLEKKMKLLMYFGRYMNEHLLKAGEEACGRECDTLSRVPYLYQWMRSTSGVLMTLTNGTLQINFLDHNKIILCPHMAAVTHIDVEKNFRTFKFSTIEENGCSQSLAKCLSYAHEKINTILSTGTTATTTTN